MDDNFSNMDNWSPEIRVGGYGYDTICPVEAVTLIMQQNWFIRMDDQRSPQFLRLQYWVTYYANSDPR